MSEKPVKKGTEVDLKKIEAVHSEVLKRLKSIRDIGPIFENEDALEKHIKDRVLDLLKGQGLVEGPEGGHEFKEQVKNILAQNEGTVDLVKALNDY